MLGIVKSFKPSFYKNIYNQSLGRSYGFLVVFVLLISLLISSGSIFYVNKSLPKAYDWIDRNFQYIINDLPQIKIENGQLTRPQTRFLKEWDEGFVFLVVPQKDDYFSIINEYENIALLTQDSLILKFDKGNQGQSEIKTFDLARIELLSLTPGSRGLNILFKDKTFDFNESSIKKFLRRLIPILFPIFFIYFFFLYLVIKPLQVVIFSLGALIINNLTKAKLSYKQLLNIGVYAMVPPVLIVLFLQFLNIHFFILYVIIYFVYLYFGISSVKELTNKAQEIECQSSE